VEPSIQVDKLHKINSSLHSSKPSNIIESIIIAGVDDNIPISYFYNK